MRLIPEHCNCHLVLTHFLCLKCPKKFSLGAHICEGDTCPVHKCLLQEIQVIVFLSSKSGSIADTMHYRLRGPIGLLNVQKVSESRRLFLTEGTSKTDNFALFVKIMTPIFCTTIFIQGWQSETGQKSDKCLEKPERGLRRS